MNRIILTFILLYLFVAPACSTSQNKSDGLPRVRHMIDTHIHLYDTRRKDGVPWPPPNDTVLYKPHLPDEFKQVSQPSGLTGVVIVEASDRLPDNRWVLDLVKDDDYFVALVGNVDLHREDFEQHVTTLAKDKRFVGIRGRRKGGVDFTNERVLANLKTLAKHNLSLDMLINGKGTAGVNQVNHVATSVPDLRIIVNHVLGYNIDGKALSTEWKAAVKQVAQNPNVYCKVSGLYQRCVPQPAPQDTEHYRDILDELWKNFGKKRLVFGSNWPCTKKNGDYTSFVRLVSSYFVEKGQDACEHYFWKNAAEAYRLNLKSTTKK